MTHFCRVCGKPSLFYIWSTSRVFDRQKFLEQYRENRDATRDEEHTIIHGNYVVCQYCMNKHKLKRVKGD